MVLTGTALVTGGSRRIGRAIANTLARTGYAVAVHSRKPSEDLNVFIKELSDTGARVAPVYGDLTQEEDVKALLPAAEQALGAAVTLLVNNASIFEEDDYLSASWDAFDKHMAIHAKCPMTLSAALYNALPDDTDGQIVNIIDQRVLRPNPSFATYSLSKAAEWMLTKTLAQRLAPRVRVNAIGPGPTLANDFQQASEFEGEAANVPLGRATNPQDIADSVLFLARTESITGQLIALDGGQHLGWRTPDYDFGGQS